MKRTRSKKSCDTVPLNFEAFIREAFPSMFLLERKDDGREEGAKLSGTLLLF